MLLWVGSVDSDFKIGMRFCVFIVRDSAQLYAGGVNESYSKVFNNIPIVFIFMRRQTKQQNNHHNWARSN